MGDTNKELLDLMKQSNEKLDKELKAIKDEAEKQKAQHAAKVESINATLAAKDATLKDIQDEVLSLKAKGGKSSTIITNEQISTSNSKHIKGFIWDYLERQKSDTAAFEEGSKGARKKFLAEMKKKAASPILSGNLSGNPYFDYLPAEMGQRPFGQTRFREFSPVYQSDTQFVLYPQQTTAPADGSFNFQQTENTGKAQLDYDWTMIQLNLKYFAGFSKVSRQALQNIPFLQSYLPMNLMEDLLDQEDKNFGNDLFTGATGSISTTGATSGSDIEYICAYIKNLIKTKFIPSAVAINPDSWLNVLLTKPGSTITNYSLPAIASIDPEGVIRLLGRPVLPVNWLTSTQVIVGDWSRVGVVESDGLTLRQTDSDGTDFVQNVLTFLLERSEGLAIFRPDAFVAGTLAV
jgi:HK97 family phage major capsid protein